MFLQTASTAQCVEQAWYLVERRSAKQVSFLNIHQLIVTCDHSVVIISVSNHLNYFIVLKIILS